jgi:site-specific DNA recombinase
LHLNGIPPDHLRRVTGYVAAAADELKDGPPERQHQLLSALVHRIILHADSIHIDIKRTGLIGLLAEPDAGTASGSEEPFSLVMPIQLKRRGVEAKLVIRAAGSRCPSPDKKLITLFADAHRWIDDLAQGRAASVRDLARLHDRDAGDISRTLPLAFLTPDIVEAILGGRQPIDLTPRRLKRMGALPCRWAEQRRRLGFQP